MPQNHFENPTAESVATILAPRCSTSRDSQKVSALLNALCKIPTK